MTDEIIDRGANYVAPKSNKIAYMMGSSFLALGVAPTVLYPEREFYTHPDLVKTETIIDVNEPWGGY